MVAGWRYLLILCVLGLAGERSLASGAREDRAYSAAADAFRDGLWARAETQFAQFAAGYPESDRVPGALLMQAQAEFKQGKFAQTVALLNARQADAGPLADDYLYWAGQAQFQGANYAAAAETFDKLAGNYPVSPWRLEAVLDEAMARSKLGAWPDVIQTLEQKDGVFQEAVQTNAAIELVVRGQLLLAEAKYRQNDFTGAEAVLQLLADQKLKPDFDWQRAYWFCRSALAAGDTNAALAGATNLVRLAGLTGRDDLRAESVSQLAGALEQLGQATNAMAVYRQNLTNAPAEMQRQAIFKIAELALAQNQFADAVQALGDYLARFSGAPAADLAMLTLGELQLKNYLAQPPATNGLAEAQARFEQLINTYTNSPLLGKAHLDLGWCFWIKNENKESLDAFKTAVQFLPPSDDLMVARFKLGDALLVQENDGAARDNYLAVTKDFTNYPGLGEKFHAQALYQLLRACLKLKDLASATNALGQLLKVYPTSSLADNGALLVGEGMADLGQPASARALFQKFEEQYPDSPQQPEVELAVARTYEQEQKWLEAIGVYDAWLEQFKTNAQLPQVSYARAWANYRAGRETNAFQMFTNFIAQVPATNGLAPVAQWWVADHFYREGDYPNAEKNYELVFQNWPDSFFADQARLMAGRAATARHDYVGANTYFTSLTLNTNTPPDLDAQALFAYGGVLMLMEPPDTNDSLAYFSSAIGVFQVLCGRYEGRDQADLAALARGEMGNCFLQLSDYKGATNCYWQVINSPAASVAARSEAQYGIGLVFQKRAEALPAGDEQAGLLNLALQNYLEVLDLYKGNLRAGEAGDPFWTKKAGLDAAAVLETLGQWTQARNVYKDLENLFPPLKDYLEKKILKLPAGKN